MSVLTATIAKGLAFFTGTSSFRTHDDSSDNKVAGVFSHNALEFSATEADEWTSWMMYINSLLSAGIGSIVARNETGGTLTKGTLVYISSVNALVEAGDAAAQLSSWVLNGLTLANTNGMKLYWTLTNSGSNRTINLYSDPGLTVLVASGTLSGDGSITITDGGSGSGISGSVTVDYTVDDTDSANILSLNVPLLSKADPADVTKVPCYVLDADLATATTGTAYSFRRVSGVDTSGYAAVGSKVYASAATPGAATPTAPTTTDQCFVGIVTEKHATTGSILFFPALRLVEKFGARTFQAQATFTANVSFASGTFGTTAAGGVCSFKNTMTAPTSDASGGDCAQVYAKDFAAGDCRLYGWFEGMSAGSPFALLGKAQTFTVLQTFNAGSGTPSLYVRDSSFQLYRIDGTCNIIDTADTMALTVGANTVLNYNTHGLGIFGGSFGNPATGTNVLVLGAGTAWTPVAGSVGIGAAATTGSTNQTAFNFWTAGAGVGSIATWTSNTNYGAFYLGGAGNDGWSDNNFIFLCRNDAATDANLYINSPMSAGYVSVMIAGNQIGQIGYLGGGNYTSLHLGGAGNDGFSSGNYVLACRNDSATDQALYVNCPAGGFWFKVTGATVASLSSSGFNHGSGNMTATGANVSQFEEGSSWTAIGNAAAMWSANLGGVDGICSMHFKNESGSIGIFGSYPGATVYAALYLCGDSAATPSATSYTLATRNSAGDGNLYINALNSGIYFKIADVGYWAVNTGSFYPTTDASYDLGGAANRVRDLYASRNFYMSGGFVEGVEMTAPAAPAANGWRVFGQDNGAGKTQLMCIFNSGAAQQLAIQP